MMPIRNYAAAGRLFPRGLDTSYRTLLKGGELDPSFKTPLLRAAIAYFNLPQYAAGEKLIDELEKA